MTTIRKEEAEDLGLLVSSDSDPVVREIRTGETEQARTDSRGIVRELRGSGAYSSGTYELVDNE